MARGDSRRRGAWPGEIVLELAAAVLLGRALYSLAGSFVGGMAIPYAQGLKRGDSPFFSLLTGTSPYTVFNGSLILYGRVMTEIGAFLLASVVVLLLVIYARRRETQARHASGDVNTRICPECLSLIPAAARRCAHCRSQVEPVIAQTDGST